MAANKDSAPPLARVHLTQTTFVSLWGGLLIVVASALFIAFGGLHWEWTWVVVIMYFTCIHSTLVVFGMFGLAKAMAGQVWRFPLIGPCDSNDTKPALQRYRVYAQIGFFALFTLTPIFDLLRYDLTEKHAYFLTFQWHVGIDDLIAGRVEPGAAAGQPRFVPVFAHPRHPGADHRRRLGSGAAFTAAGGARTSRWSRRSTG